MDSLGPWFRIVGLLVVVSLGSVSNVESQDLFREMDKVKRELSDLKTELRELKEVVYGLRRAVLKSVASEGERASPDVDPSLERAAKQESVLDEKEATRLICQTVGKFFTQAETILQAADVSTADERMKQALRTLNSSLRNYADMHRVAKILNIYEGLAWDAYVAVELRGSVAGNAEFWEALSKHKRKYIETCPKH